MNTMHKLTRYVLVAFILFVTPLAMAETFSNAVLTLSVPDGFTGPTTASLGPETEVAAYVKPYSGASGGTLLQITTYDFRSALEGMPESERGNASEYYLGQFLGGLERKRSAFSTGHVQRITLGGVPASRVTWIGRADGTPASGVMYCVIIGTIVVSLHTQDADGAPAGNRAQAISAIDGLMVKDSS